MNRIIPRLANADTRGMVARSVIEILRGFSVLNFGTPDVCATIEENLIVAAIVVGQSDGRLMTASDIAAYIGLPRPTVIRKLRTVAMARMLGKVKDGNRACYYIKDPNNTRSMDEIRKIMFAIKQCGERLSNLDTPGLDH